MLRAIELGVSIQDLDNIELGLFYDILTEKANDSVEYPIKATQEDIDNF